MQAYMRLFGASAQHGVCMLALRPMRCTHLHSRLCATLVRHLVLGQCRACCRLGCLGLSSVYVVHVRSCMLYANHNNTCVLRWFFYTPCENCPGSGCLACMPAAARKELEQLALASVNAG